MLAIYTEDIKIFVEMIRNKVFFLLLAFVGQVSFYMFLTCVQLTRLLHDNSHVAFLFCTLVSIKQRNAHLFNFQETYERKTLTFGLGLVWSSFPFSVQFGLAWHDAHGGRQYYPAKAIVSSLFPLNHVDRDRSPNYRQMNQESYCYLRGSL